ncbi:hypothetical protein [Halochromatium glycolicum]|uniref:hypothetical protein n=1 Tax=Halochromatium glycolicum TaxID=85075 RepID=UPI00190A5E8A|nr:hypothetical protein [Halochromatium glycolicum]
MDADNKKIVSLRLNVGDLDKVKRVARRLRVRDSAVLRFAIKEMLRRLGPLCDEMAEGVDLMPLFIEMGEGLTSHFELDQARLERVINGNLSDFAKRVDPDDIALISMGEMPTAHTILRLRELCGRPVTATDAPAEVRNYLYDKYINGLPEGDDQFR